MKNQEIQQVTIQTLTVERIKNRLQEEKTDSILTIAGVIIGTSLILGSAYITCLLSKNYQIGSGYFLVPCLGLSLFFGSKFYQSIKKRCNNNAKYQVTEEQLQKALSEEYKVLAKENLQKALDSKEKIKEFKKEIEVFISKADEYIMLGVEVEEIDVLKWSVENALPLNASTSAKAYDPEIGKLRYQLS